MSFHSLLLIFSLVALNIIYVLVTSKIIVLALFLLWAQPISLAFFLTFTLICLKRISNLMCLLWHYFLLSWNFFSSVSTSLNDIIIFQAENMEPLGKSFGLYLLCISCFRHFSSPLLMSFHCFPPPLFVRTTATASSLHAFALYPSLVVPNSQGSFQTKLRVLFPSVNHLKPPVMLKIKSKLHTMIFKVY